MERPFTFQTRQLGDPEQMVRTFGVLLDASEAPRRPLAREIDGLAEPSPPPDCAHGKVVVLTRDARGGRVACYQRSQGGPAPAVVACCNGTAAAAALHAAETDCDDLALRLHLSPRHVVRATASVRRERGGVAVAQTWQRVPFELVREEQRDGRRFALGTGALNHYLVVRLRAEEDPREVGPEQAQELSRGFGLEAEPLRARVAVVACEAGAPARLKVFTCGGREHPSAPPTGLAALALFAARVDWLPLRPRTRVLTPAGPMRLPLTTPQPDDAASVEFAPLLVRLERAEAALPLQDAG